MKPVFLIGYMCSGKTTLGIDLALVSGRRFIDLDDFVEARCGCSVAEYFATHGEAAFREAESAALREVAALDDVIVACGGGTPCHGDNIALMNDAGITVWLTTSPERLAARLSLPEQKAKRPLVAELDDNELLQYVRDNLKRREPFYAQAQIKFDATDIETAAQTRITAHRLAQKLRDL